MKKILLLLVVVLSLSLPIYAFSSAKDLAEEGGVEGLNLQVESPQWSDQVIYFILTDRFNDGDPTNNDQGVGEYDPTSNDYYSGGDLQGIIDKVDYIKNLGATAVWITPPVANQWFDPWVNVTGYHGYWGVNFKEVDRHYGTLDTYKKLSSTLHNNGMYLIQDIVPNHTGNFFTYQDDKYNPDNKGENFILNKDSEPVAQPTQYPFNLNNYKKKEDREANIYHWTPKINNFKDESQEETYQMSDLDDINTENPLVRKVLRDSYGYWIKEVGVDGFRVDTVKYIEHDFWHDFIHSKDKQALGMANVAQKLGKDNFLMFGEIFESSEPLKDNGDRKVTSYLGTDQKPELPAVLNFPLHVTLRRVFAEGKPTHYLGYRLKITMDSKYYKDPYITPLFIDNHDIARFLEKGSRQAMEQSLMFMFTIPGIPIIYQGTEQGFTIQRAAMFAQGVDSGGKDHFDQEAEMYQFIKKLAELRTSNRLLTRGSIEVLQDNHSGAGVFAYQREYKGKKALIIFNTADKRVLMSNLDTGLVVGTKLTALVQRGGIKEVVVGESSKVTMELPPRAGLILVPEDQPTELVNDDNQEIIVDNKINGKVFTKDIELEGKIRGEISQLEIVVDGNLDQAIPAKIAKNGSWQATLPIHDFALGESIHQLVVYAPEQKIVSNNFNFNTNNLVERGFSFELRDPKGDDRGLDNNYTLPQDSSFGAQMDIRKVEVIPLGGNLKIKLTMGEISDIWKPDNGFDHVLFNIFIDLDNGVGAEVLPKLNSKAPAGFEWDYLAFVDGWNNAYYSAKGATAENYGTSVTPAPKISTNKKEKTIEFNFKAQSFAHLDSLAGAKIYITTWDFDGSQGMLRPLTTEGGTWIFGGRDDKQDSLIADDTEVITIKNSGNPKYIDNEIRNQEIEEFKEEVGSKDKIETNKKLAIETVHLVGTINNWNFEEGKMERVSAGIYQLEIIAPAPSRDAWIPAAKNQAFKFATNGSWSTNGGGPAYIGTEGQLKEDTGMDNIYVSLEEGAKYRVTVDLNKMTYSISKVSK
ncbi:glycosidase [Orenia metallireducens]|uniref:Glycosidase n=1 Tax=Orenia metallireducens TaxID=1413210 RepID=A0A285HMP7_9FIRM|nr:alpha-amylase family glycosyl hydrolase [Orenia metallireducens]PRX26965.1 glycosidase [Orenia metallireducens]SNY37002.1 Glycosidase [Orenia metallireducens]